MFGFSGEINCSLDDKGRLQFPAKFLKQLPESSCKHFVVNCGTANCLHLRTLEEWNSFAEKLSQLNQFDPKNAQFIRWFMQGHTEVVLDNNNRILLPKNLLQRIKVQKNVVLLGCFDKLEIWSDSEYENYMTFDPQLFASLAAQVLHNNTANNSATII